MDLSSMKTSKKMKTYSILFFMIFLGVAASLQAEIPPREYEKMVDDKKVITIAQALEVLDQAGRETNLDLTIIDKAMSSKDYDSNEMERIEHALDKAYDALVAVNDIAVIHSKHSGLFLEILRVAEFAAGIDQAPTAGEILVNFYKKEKNRIREILEKKDTSQAKKLLIYFRSADDQNRFGNDPYSHDLTKAGMYNEAFETCNLDYIKQSNWLPLILEYDILNVLVHKQGVRKQALLCNSHSVENIDHGQLLVMVRNVLIHFLDTGTLNQTLVDELYSYCNRNEELTDYGFLIKAIQDIGTYQTE